MLSILLKDNINMKFCSKKSLIPLQSEKYSNHNFLTTPLDLQQESGCCRYQLGVLS